MQKLKLLFIALPFVSTFSFATEDVSGHRIGAGYSHVEDVTDSNNSYTRGTGIKLEYGYEFNKIFGLNAAFSAQNGNVMGVNVDSYSHKLDTDIGYTFVFDSFSIKPYGSAGLVLLHEQYGNFIDASEAALTVGIGTRVVFNQHFYADISYDIAAYEEVDLDTISFTLGYKF
jgi:opacity protein-like surface antigen